MEVGFLDLDLRSVSPSAIGWLTTDTARPGRPGQAGQVITTGFSLFFFFFFLFHINENLFNKMDYRVEELLVSLCVL